MSKTRRSRSRSTYYSQAGEQYVDCKSKQLLFHQAQVCTLGRTRLNDNEEFQETTARDLLTNHYKKRKSHGYVLCLVDRLRFQKNKNTASKAYRKDLTYREIKHFYQFKAMPEVFMLGVEEEKTGKRTYESFKCKREEDVLMMQSLTAKAFQDPQFLLRHASPVRQISMSPSLSNDSRIHNGQANSNTISVVSANQNRNSTIYYSTHEHRSPTLIRTVQRQASPPSHHSPDEYFIRSRPVSIERQIDRKDRSSTIGTASTYHTTAWSEDITYLMNDHEHGPQITDCGPIYMYVSRAEHTEVGNGVENGSIFTPRMRSSFR